VAVGDFSGTGKVFEFFVPGVRKAAGQTRIIDSEQVLPQE
jgi:hypothetical protein